MSDYEISRQGALAPSQSEAEKTAEALMPVLKQAYESKVVDESAIRQTIQQLKSGFRQVVEIHYMPTPKGRPYGFRREAVFNTEHDAWDIYIDVPNQAWMESRSDQELADVIVFLENSNAAKMAAEEFLKRYPQSRSSFKGWAANAHNHARKLLGR